MLEASVVYLLFVVLTGFFGQQQVIGFSTQEDCLATRSELQAQGVPDISGCIPLLIQGTPGTETPDDAKAMIQRPLQP